MAKHSMECKKIMVDEISCRLKEADILIVTNYKGLSAQDMNVLRRELREVSSEYLVVKDSAARRAIAEGPNSRISEFINGEVGIAIDKKGDPIYISKVLVRFAKDRNVLEIYGGIVKGDLVSRDDVKALAALPSREVLLAMLANTLNAPVQGLAGALAAILSKILYALNAVKEQKEKAPQLQKAQETGPVKNAEEAQKEPPKEIQGEKKLKED